MDRRTKEGYRLRIYLEAIKTAELITDEQWIALEATNEGRFVSRLQWISHLKQCALSEAESLMVSQVSEAA